MKTTLSFTNFARHNTKVLFRCPDLDEQDELQTITKSIMTKQAKKHLGRNIIIYLKVIK